MIFKCWLLPCRPISVCFCWHMCQSQHKLRTIIVKSAKWRNDDFFLFHNSNYPSYIEELSAETDLIYWKMDRILVWVLSGLVLLLLPVAYSEEDEVKRSLIQFMTKISPGNAGGSSNWGWSMNSDPCTDKWEGVECDSQSKFVRKVVLDGFNLDGFLDAESLCKVKTLAVLSLNNNSIIEKLPEQISSCKRLTHLYANGNHFSGELPRSLSRLSNLKRLHISNNNFSGVLPDLPRISGLISFLVENNQLSGEIPKFDFSNLQLFNVSNNNFRGPIPDVNRRFSATSFSGNPGLCGPPLSNTCPPSPPPKNGSKGFSSRQLFVYSGYVILGLIFVLFIVYKTFSKKKPKGEKGEAVKKGESKDTSSNKPSSVSSVSIVGSVSSQLKTSDNRSEYSITSAEVGMTSSSLTVLSSPVVNGLRFEELLRSPAELIGRGKHGSLYKVVLENKMMTLAVKRIKDWGISSRDFKRRMEKIDQVKHPNVLPPLAFYCSKQEKLLVYEYQQNGSLFKLLYGTENGNVFEWRSRLGVASSIAEALAFMHTELHDHGIAHGNLKSTNILLGKDMDPCISEYGLMVVEDQDQQFLAQADNLKSNSPSGYTAYSTFKVDVYGFGVILLELLTGKLVQNSGFDFARWVHSVVREKWTLEVFDRALILEGANEERMVKLLQVGLKCINPSPGERPTINQVAGIINTIKDEEERSIVSL